MRLICVRAAQGGMTGCSIILVWRVVSRASRGANPVYQLHVRRLPFGLGHIDSRRLLIFTGHYSRLRRHSGGIVASRMSSMVKTPMRWSSWSRTGPRHGGLCLGDVGCDVAVQHDVPAYEEVRNVRLILTRPVPRRVGAASPLVQRRRATRGVNWSDQCTWLRLPLRCG